MSKRNLYLRHAVLYLNPHNATMSTRSLPAVCVLRISRSILERDDAIISDKNAAVKTARFFTKEAYELKAKAAEQLCASESNVTSEKTRVRQSEVLVPYQIMPEYIQGIIVGLGADKRMVEEKIKTSVVQEKIDLPIAIIPSIFFLSRMTGVLASTMNPQLFLLDQDTIYLQKKDKLVVFWSGDGVTLNSKNVTGTYKSDLLGMMPSDVDWDNYKITAQTEPQKFEKILLKCGAWCPLERFALLDNWNVPISPYYPESSSSEDEGNPIPLIRRRS